jgi:gluconolactonase
MLADRIDGRLHNQPYDLAVDRMGRIWFTDPEPALRMMEPPIDHASVLRLERDNHGTWAIRRMTHDTLFPTAIAFSKDQRSLFVADNPSGRSKPPELRSYALRPDDMLRAPEILQSFADGVVVKGMCVTPDGNLVMCLGGRSSSLAMLSSTGDVLNQHPFGPGEPTNCSIGGRDMTTLYVTSSEGCLYRAEAFCA